MQVFTPANDTVLVLRDEVKEKKSDGGIIYADRAVELANQGEVRAASSTSQYKAADRVVFTKYAGSEIELNGVTYLLLKEKEIQGTIIEVNVGETVKEKQDQLQKALAQFEATGRG
jgi:chaperonin GroES